MQKYGTAVGDLQRSRDRGIRGYGFQAIFGLNQRLVVLLLQQGKDGLGFQIVFHDLFADGPRQIGFVKGKGSVVSQTDTLDADHRAACAQRELLRDGLSCREHAFIQHAR